MRKLALRYIPSGTQARSFQRNGLFETHIKETHRLTYTLPKRMYTQTNLLIRFEFLTQIIII